MASKAASTVGGGHSRQRRKMDSYRVAVKDRIRGQFSLHRLKAFEEPVRCRRLPLHRK